MEREQPIQDEYRKDMNALAHFLSDHLKPAGFALFVFDMDAPGRMNYISNASREHMVEAMREFIARNDGTYTDPNNVYKAFYAIEKVLTMMEDDAERGNVDTVAVSCGAIREAIKQARDLHQ